MLHINIFWSWFCLLAVAASVYLLLSPFVARPLYKRHIFKPSKYPSGNYDVDSVGQIKRQEFYFPSTGNTKLHAWFFDVHQSHWVILLSHGNSDNLTRALPLIGELIAAGASVFIYDYRGYGKSAGSPTIKGICDDSRAAYDFLTNNLQISPKRIVLYGESLGTGVSCYLSRQVSCAGLILQSGYVSLWKIGRQKFPFLHIYPNFLFPRPHLDNLAVIKSKHPPLLLVHGEQDTVVSISDTEELYRHANEPKMFARLPEVAHANVIESDKFLATVKQFLSKLPLT